MAHVPIYLVLTALGFAAVAIALVDPLLVAGLAVPGVLVIHRVGGANLNLSVSDVLTVVGTVVAVPLLRADMRVTRRLLWIALLFEAVLVLTVIDHPNRLSILEWFHRLFLVGGSISVGAVLGRNRRAKGPAVAFLVVTTALAVAAIATSLTHGLAPAYPFGLEKNFVGAMTAFAVLFAVLNPSWLRLTNRQALTVASFNSAGLLASQSRGAIVALAAALLIATVHQRRVSRSVIVAAALAAPLMLFAVVSLRNELNQHVEFNSLTYRSDYRALAYHDWHLSPLFGQGLRYFNKPGSVLSSDAHNVVATTLAESGLIGLAAFALLILGTLLVLWRLPAQTATIAVAFVVGRFVHGLSDIYWVAGPTTLPWLIVGIVSGTVDADRAERSEMSRRSDTRPVDSDSDLTRVDPMRAWPDRRDPSSL